MTKAIQKYSFYRPHARVQAKNELIDHKTGEVINPPSMTKQSFVKECDINNVIKQYSSTGQISHINAKAALGTYQDLPELDDFQTALNLTIQAETAFASLPSHVRRRFGDDPAEFLAFMGDPANKDEMKALGLLKDQPGTPLAAPSSEAAPEPEKPAQK